MALGLSRPCLQARHARAMPQRVRNGDGTEVMQRVVRKVERAHRAVAAQHRPQQLCALDKQTEDAAR
eukprot:SAG11_NODE_10066_length_859_cov_1.142105_1_plen_67_part_00